MKRFLQAILLVALPCQLIAQNPELTSLNPSKYQTQSEPTIMNLRINGNKIWPDFLTLLMTIEVMDVHFKKDGRDQIMPFSSISSSSLSLSFNSAGWVDKPGPIEVYITVESVAGRPAHRSNSLFINVEPTATVAPLLNSLSNSSFKTGSPKEKYYIRVYGKNFGESRSTSVSIGGLPASIGYANLTDGVIDVWVPADVYTKAGTYPVQVNSKYGASNTLPLKIEGATTLIKVNPVSGVKPVTVKPTVMAKPPTAATTIATRNLTLNSENAARLNAEMVRGARITMVGLITDPSISAQLENYILSLENVFVVDNQLSISSSPGNININLKANRIDRPAIDKLKKQISDKAVELKITVEVSE